MKNATDVPSESTRESLAERLRELPAVEQLLSRLACLREKYPRQLLTSEIRRVLREVREELTHGGELDESALAERIGQELHALATPSLRRVINATGVVLHTNLGRAPLVPFTPISGYSNLEYDLQTGKRGKRDIHAAGLLERLLGRPAIVVNNNAAAVYLALRELACGFEVVVSRGELIEIGDGFRIPEIMRESGAVLCEVGTTNRTNIADYRQAVNDRTRLLLRVHPSNFWIRGFTARPSVKELVALGKEKGGIPVYEDLGSGCITDLERVGITEPLITESLEAGVDLVSFSGDKLLGGPQAGILVGNPELIARLRHNPIYRALRLDKLILQALEETLRCLLMERWDEVPALRMIRQGPDEIRARAERLARELEPICRADLLPGRSVIGGGSSPEYSLPTWLIAITTPDVTGQERRLRSATPPVIGRIEEGKLLLDLRTVSLEEESELAGALRACLSHSSDPR